MDTEIIVGASLRPEDRARWLRWQTTQPAYASPFFHPRFTESAIRAGREVMIALQSDAGVLSAVLPFERAGRRIVPVAHPMNDSHGPVLAPGGRFDLAAFMRACQATTLAFDHLMPATQAAFAPHVEAIVQAPWMNLERGLDHYRKQLDHRAREQLSNTRRKANKIGREVGALRLEADCRDPQMLERLIEWKRAQYRRTGAPDLFARGWPADLLRTLHASDDPDCRGSVSVLWAGERVLALYYNLRSRRHVHGWFPVYDPDHARLSPGSVLRWKLTEHYSGSGVAAWSLGKGEWLHKQLTATDRTPVAEVYVELRRLPRLLRQLRRRLLTALKASRPYAWARAAKRKLSGIGHR